jgi:hypothetical protein
LAIADCGRSLPIAACPLAIADCGRSLPIAACPLAIADCGLSLPIAACHGGRSEIAIANPQPAIQPAIGNNRQYSIRNQVDNPQWTSRNRQSAIANPQYNLA